MTALQPNSRLSAGLSRLYGPNKGSRAEGSRFSIRSRISSNLYLPVASSFSILFFSILTELTALLHYSTVYTKSYIKSSLSPVGQLQPGSDVSWAKGHSKMFLVPAKRKTDVYRVVAISDVIKTDN